MSKEMTLAEMIKQCLGEGEVEKTERTWEGEVKWFDYKVDPESRYRIKPKAVSVEFKNKVLIEHLFAGHRLAKFKEVKVNYQKELNKGEAVKQACDAIYAEEGNCPFFILRCWVNGEPFNLPPSNHYYIGCGEFMNARGSLMTADEEIKE